ncbi:hypothetical protein BDL97_04G092600 [Sphagnum fallax]|nr:hypothetical protein BDL97_04G092600 [Sphagnum fallax]
MDLLLAEPRTILVALDESPGAEFAFEWALKNYCKPNDVLHLLHVRHATDDVASEVEQKMEVAAQALLQTFLDRATLAKIKCKGRVVVGDERHEICKEVLWVCADVLIVGSRGLNRMQRVFLGSVSEYCAQHCACPVIIVKPMPEGRKFSSNGSLSDDSTSENHIPGLDATEDDL